MGELDLFAEKLHPLLVTLQLLKDINAAGAGRGSEPPQAQGGGRAGRLTEVRRTDVQVAVGEVQVVK
ncbi:hypothetical protein [Streptomyces griseofuscus]|uniref:hypothetical protein n=1 Tax=Streptomyces griseofuscus TaxID=146922 RepID=UPI0036A164CE